MRGAAAFRTSAPERQVAPSPEAACPAFCHCHPPAPPQPAAGSQALRTRQFSRWNKALTPAGGKAVTEEEKTILGVGPQLGCGKRSTGLGHKTHGAPKARVIQASTVLMSLVTQMLTIEAGVSAVAVLWAPRDDRAASTCGPCPAVRPSPGATGCPYTPGYRQFPSVVASFLGGWPPFPNVNTAGVQAWDRMQGSLSPVTCLNTDWFA